ncbi:hypothetical protein MJO28_007059 [Puccinia striiformis f. sp. tritici]|uniref:Uncharacterized protein n=1 Tax=Puccinia striiformis f. sp. tritici TaxID=168172 RepID=A0ACC0EDE5_9BASI|nr:hypothetical protein MJO28_007059 [Puccinia striiformis f. sp. tritici]KAI7955617.1 hypothetical protein MJO29_007016 [Puccinia striiformis f. sp. tritici]
MASTGIKGIHENFGLTFVREVRRSYFDGRLGTQQTEENYLDWKPLTTENYFDGKLGTQETKENYFDGKLGTQQTEENCLD